MALNMGNEDRLEINLFGTLLDRCPSEPHQHSPSDDLT